MRAKRAAIFLSIAKLHPGSASSYMTLKKPVFYMIICKQLSTFAAELLRRLLSEDIDKKNNDEVRFEARGVRETFVVC